MNVTPENITELKPHEIFVFGSNLAGRHGAGAALIAPEKFGARPGYGWGLMGQCYALPTKDDDLKPLPLEHIWANIALFTGYAMASPQRHYLVTAIGCGLAGYTPEQVAPAFTESGYVPNASYIPKNISLPASFWDVLKKKK